MSELKPCPFCGQEMGETINSDGNYCEHYCSFIDYSGTLNEEGKTKWNTRPVEDALSAENEALKAKVAELEAENERLKRQLNINQYDLDGMASEILNGGE